MVSHAYVMLAQEGEARDVLHGQTMKIITRYEASAEKRKTTRAENKYFTNVIKAVLGMNFHDILIEATAMYCSEPCDEPTSWTIYQPNAGNSKLTEKCQTNKVDPFKVL